MVISFDEVSALAQGPPTPEGRRIAQVFRALRIAAGLTQEEAARRAGLTLAGYRPYEQGKRGGLRLDQVPRFAAAFGVSVELLSERLGLPGASLREVYAADLNDLATQLHDLPAETADTLLEFFRHSIEIQHRLHLGRGDDRSTGR